MNQNENPYCCEEMKSSADIIFWTDKTGFIRFNKETWAMRSGCNDEFIAINFCPFCGTRLEPPAERNRCAECGKYTENGIGVGTGKIFVEKKQVDFVYLCDDHIKSENGILINCQKVRMEYPAARTD